MQRPVVAWIGVLLAAAVFAVACNGDKSTSSDATATLTLEDATPLPPTATRTPPPFQGGRDPVGKEGVTIVGPIASPARQETYYDFYPPLLVDVRTSQIHDYDRIVFEFAGAVLPGYRVEYVEEPVDCGSGQPSFQGVAGGGAFLQVRFTPAAAHDDDGSLTFGVTELTSPSARKTCDFEGVLTWVLLLDTSGPRDFRVLTNIVVEPPSAIVVDVARP